MPKKQRIIIIAGPNGAGKTTFAREYLLHEGHDNSSNTPQLISAGSKSMSRRTKTHSREIEDTLRALRRAAKRALELGLQTGTPVYVWKDGKIIDLTKEQRPTRKAKPKRTLKQG